MCDRVKTLDEILVMIKMKEVKQVFQTELKVISLKNTSTRVTKRTQLLTI